MPEKDPLNWTLGTWILALSMATLRKSGVWEAEMVDSSPEPVVTALILTSEFSVTDEVAT